jgi:hypothetical protein
MDLQSLLNGAIGQDLIKGLSSQTGEDNSKVSSALSMAIPFLLSQMDKNTNTEEGAASLSNALEKHSTDDLEAKAKDVTNSSDISDGLGILGHVFGEKQNNVTNNISKQTGISSQNATQLLASVAPLVMSFLSKQKSESGLDASGVSGLLTSIVGNAKQSDSSGMSMIESMLDSDHDGSIADDVMDLGSKLLGGFFK